MIAALWSAAALAALWYGLAHAGAKGSWQASLIKTLSTAALALAGLAMGAPLWIVAGLALGSAGDFALSRPGTRWFLAGMAAFALGHLAYVAAFLGSSVPLAPGTAGWAVIAGLLMLIASTEVWLAPHTGALRWPVRGYGLVIGAMAVAAILLPAGPGQAVMRIGAALFLVSDVILALRMFRLRAPGAQLLASRILWPLYWGGQALILWGAVAG